MRLVTRAAWGAKQPKEPLRSITLPTPRLWVHHTGGSEHGAQGMRDIQRYHQGTKGWNDIAYSFLIDLDGTVFEGRGVGKAGAHTEGDNSRSHAICLMGNFENIRPTEAAINSLVELARQGRQQGWWTPTLDGHRNAPGASTACPGEHLYDLLPKVRERTAMSEDDDMTPSQLAEAYRTEPVRPVLKTLITGALVDGLREPTAANKDRGALRGLFADVVRDALEGLVIVREVPVEDRVGPPR